MRKVMKNAAVQAFLASILCILLGLLIGYIVLLFINPEVYFCSSIRKAHGSPS